VLSGHGGEIYDVVFSPNGKLLASGSYDNYVRLWDLERDPIPSLVLHPIGAGVAHLRFSPDSSLLATASNGATAIQLWAVRDGADAIPRSLLGLESTINHLEFSPDGGRLAAASEDGTARLWDVASGVGRSLIGHSARVLDISFSPDGVSLFTASGDGTARRWVDDLPFTERALRAWLDAATPETLEHRRL
jgi:eukaryotic-like serine/threonine-protein kinase